MNVSDCMYENIAGTITYTRIASSTVDVIAPIISTVPESHRDLKNSVQKIQKVKCRNICL